MIGVSSANNVPEMKWGRHITISLGVGTPSDLSYLDHPNKEGNEEVYPLQSMIGNCWNLECTRRLQICNSFLFRIGLFGTFYVS